MSRSVPPGETLSHWEGEPVEVHRAVWRVPVLEVYRSLPSTSDRARDLAVAGAPPMTAVLAEEQTAGRGRGGRRWSSPTGLGLWLSVVLPDPASGQDAGEVLPLLVGLAVARAVETSVPDLRVRMKWPNDLLADDRKFAGILCERVVAPGRGSPVVAGVGVNVAQRTGDFPPEIRGTATSLELLRGGRVSRSRLVGRVLAGLHDVRVPPTGVLGPEVMGELGRRDALVGGEVVTGSGLRGLVEGIDPRGALLLRVPGRGVVPVTAGEVEKVRRTTAASPGGGQGGGARPGGTEPAGRVGEGSRNEGDTRCNW